MTTEQTDNDYGLESTLGELLHRTRKARHKSIEEAAESTRINASFIRAMEKDDFGKLPAAVFTRGFIRLYATYLGLDPDDTFRHYDDQEKIEAPEPKVKQYRHDVIDEEIMDWTSIFIKRKKSKVLPVTILLIILLLFYMLGVFLKTEDRYPDRPGGTDLLTPRVDGFPAPMPGEATEPEEPVGRPEEPTGKATPVKAPQFTKRQIPEKPAAIAEYEPVPAAEPAVQAPAEPGATVKPEVSAKSAARPFTVNVATDTPLAPPDTNEPAVTVKIPADLP